MYTCIVCKEEKEGDPVMTNNAGSFCGECRAAMQAKSAESRKRIMLEWDGRCIWCNNVITAATRQNCDEEKRVCIPCAAHRDWLLKCIRHSDKPLKYILATEEREKAGREKRKKENAVQLQAHAVQPDLPSEAEARLRRVELMLGKLTQALGV